MKALEIAYGKGNRRSCWLRLLVGVWRNQRHRTYLISTCFAGACFYFFSFSEPSPVDILQKHDAHDETAIDTLRSQRGVGEIDALARLSLSGLGVDPQDAAQVVPKALAGVTTDKPALPFLAVITIPPPTPSVVAVVETTPPVAPPAGVESMKRRKFAFATFLSSDPKPGKLARLDGAGVLAESIRTHMGHLEPDLLAVVPPNVVTSRPILQRFGYSIREYELPDLSKVQRDDFRTSVVKSGCCGHGEMLKLQAYNMIEYERVIVMDTDTLVHASFEELLLHDTVTIFTAPYASTQNEQLQGALIIVKPNPARFDEIMTTWYAGRFGSDGWNASGIGYSYGGDTVQGILPYFTRKVHPEDSEEVDHCMYNHNGDHNNYCNNFDHKRAKVNHFTVCQKPWYCLFPHSPNSCMYFTFEWWKMYNQLARKLGTSKTEERPCDYYRDGMSSKYPPLLPEAKPVTDGW